MTFHIVLQTILQNLLFGAIILAIIVFWMGCASFWVRFITENHGVALTNKQIVAVYILAPIMFVGAILYSVPYKILNWVTELKKKD